MKAEPTMMGNTKGFTLVEVMIVVVILGVLASIALPMYRENVIQSRRSEAKAAIEEVRNLQYEFFQSYKRYGNLGEIGQPGTTPGGHYLVTVALSGLKFSATASATGNQADDKECAVFTLTSVETFVSYNAGGSQTFDCW